MYERSDIKSELYALDGIVQNIPEDREVCANCTHFQQHYIFADFGYGERFMTVNFGHCVHPRLKSRKPGDTCDKFVSATIMSFAKELEGLNKLVSDMEASSGTATLNARRKRQR